MMRKKGKLNRLLNALGRHMRERRKSLGLTQEQLAERSGLSTNYIARIEIADKTPSVGTLIRLADALAVGVSDLLAPDTECPWLDRAQEIARILEPLDEQDSGFVLSQVQATVTYIRLVRENQNPSKNVQQTP